MITILLTGFAILANQATSECLIFCQVSALQPQFLQIDKNIYLKGDIILLYGSIGNYTQGYNVTAKIFDNLGNVVLTQVTYPRQDSTFLLRIPTNESDWKTGGPYDLKVWYGSCCYIGDHTFTFYTDQLPPLKQEEAEIAFWNIKCNSGLTLMMKQEDGSIACVRPDSLQKLISLKWGYDPSEKLTTYGLKDIYSAGQEIDFKFRINGFGNGCEQPTVAVRNSDQKIMWQSSQYATGCANGLDTGNVKDEAYLGRESHLGYDYNQYGPLIINQTGTYFMNISWLDGNITKEFSITPSTVKQTSTIPQCVSNIQNQYAVAGPMGDTLCPVVNFQASGKIISHTGFYGVYGYSEYPGTPNFVLEPGHNGTIGYDINIGSIYNWEHEPSTNDINITNDIEFMHDAGMNNHPGVATFMDSKSEIMQKNSSAFVTITFSATTDARPGTYWVHLPPGFCAGGETIILTITNCEK